MLAERLVPCIGFVAPSGTGKTTLLRALVPLLQARGLRLGYLKHAHHGFDLDTPGKDSHQLRAAGVEQVLIASDERWALLSEGMLEPTLDALLPRFDAQRIDLVLAEGFRRSHYPKIEVHRATSGAEFLYPDDPDIIAIVADSPFYDLPLPVLPLDQPAQIADYLLAQLATQSPQFASPRTELVTYYQRLRRYGYNDAESGNASVRVGESFLITPSGAAADDLTVDELILCPLDGELPPGVSFDAQLHQLTYQQQPQAGAILHSHGADSIAASLRGADFVPLDFEVRHYFSSVPVLPVPANMDRYLEQIPTQVAATLATHPILMIASHGVYAWGNNLRQAYKWTCALELSAKIVRLVTHHR